MNFTQRHRPPQSPIPPVATAGVCPPAMPADTSPLRHVFAAVMLALTLSLPSGVQADERLEAAMAIVVPPDQTDVERLIETMTLRGDVDDAEALRARLLRLYRSDEFRQRTARVYAKYLTEAELRYLAETLQHPMFRRYREVAPEMMLELAELERDLFARVEP